MSLSTLLTDDAPLARPRANVNAPPRAAPAAAPTVPPATPASAAVAATSVDSPASHRLGALATGILAAGVLLAILTTTDAHWWQLHFSQLGTHQDLSGRAFNTTMIAAGITLASYGAVIGADLPQTIGLRRGRWLRISMTSAGGHLTLIGLIPIPVSPTLHDVAACGLVLSFISLAASSIGSRALTRRFRRYAAYTVVVLAIGMTLLICSFITLATYEAIAFSMMGVWLLTLPRALSAARPRLRSAFHADLVPPRRRASSAPTIAGRPASTGCVPSRTGATSSIRPLSTPLAIQIVASAGLDESLRADAPAPLLPATTSRSARVGRAVHRAPLNRHDVRSPNPAADRRCALGDRRTMLALPSATSVASASARTGRTQIAGTPPVAPSAAARLLRATGASSRLVRSATRETADVRRMRSVEYTPVWRLEHSTLAA